MGFDYKYGGGHRHCAWRHSVARVEGGAERFISVWEASVPSLLLPKPSCAREGGCEAPARELQDGDAKLLRRFPIVDLVVHESALLNILQVVNLLCLEVPEVALNLPLPVLLALAV